MTFTLTPTREGIALPDEFSTFSPDLQQQLLEDLTGNMEGVIPRLPQIRLLHAGASCFAFPDGTRPTSFAAVMVDHCRSNAFWPDKPTGVPAPPVCSSLDGRTSLSGEQCATCAHNQFGSEIRDDGQPGRGKACKNMARLSLLMSGHLIPFRLTIPPTSLRALDAFLTTLTDLRRPFTAYVTEFSVEEVLSAQGFAYSQVQCAPGDRLSPEQYAAVAQIRRAYLAQIRGQEIAPEEFYTQGTTGIPPARGCLPRRRSPPVRPTTRTISPLLTPCHRVSRSWPRCMAAASCFGDLDRPSRPYRQAKHKEALVHTRARASFFCLHVPTPHPGRTIVA